MKRLLSLVLTLLACTPLSAQLPMDTWKEKPAFVKLDTAYARESAIFLLDARRYEFQDEAENNLGLFKTIHKIIQLNDDKGIELFNKIYLPGGDKTMMVALKARTILPSGKVINFDSTTVKDVTDEDGSPQRIFALPGLEKGCQVEYLYTYKKDASLFGMDVLQFRIPVLRSILQIVSPERLMFDVKSFNGRSVVERKQDANFRVVNCVSPELKPAEEEKYSNLTAQLYRVEYKLSYNTARDSSARLFTWDQLAERLNENYQQFEEKETKAVQDLINTLKLSKLATPEEKLMALENHLKKNIMVNKDVESESASQIDQILRTRIASEFGIVRLYALALGQLNILYQLVITGDRSNYVLDREFENWNNADNMLLYLTAQKKYIARTRAEFRYPWIAPEWGNQLGIHCKAVTVDGKPSAVAELKNIDLLDYSQTSHNMESKIRIFPAKDSVVVESKQIFTGYTSSMYRSAFNFSSPEDQKNILKQIVKFGTNSETVLNSKLENASFDEFGKNKPFVINASVRANELMEKAGNKILLKVGDIIGPQVEMYQEKPRVFPIEIIYPHVLYRDIIVEIPEGYVAKNLESLNIQQSFPASGEPTMFFRSGYELKGNQLKITIREEYRVADYPIDQFQPFIKVINAAADFNKAVILLEKK
ncbi:MAG: DUF3857 domain-containing protein [Sphingobacteriales bacterium]|nr:MAG: DUF3857 domain-containing protein [Sphingobacteriales bacterium]